jgi:tetratricopeptide (TPR) repeat protein
MGATLRPPASIPAPAPLLRGAPAVVAGYEILEVLGRGGMGIVYKARQVGLGRLTALKMILAGTHASFEDVQRFQVEAEAVARLQHPNIVQIYEIGRHDGLPFFSLEFCAGGSLAHKLTQTPMSVRESAALIEKLARAIHYAHRQGIVHRDLKPANVLLTEDGAPKITDFGLAKRLEADAGQTGTGSILGTPTYMAPEQASGRVRDIGPAADVYALGAMLYDLLTGRPPLRGETALDTLQLVQTAEPMPVRRLQPKVPRDLETVCLKCLQKDPHKRYGSALELAEDLRAFLDGTPVRARPTPVWERALKWARRRPAAAALLVVSVAAVLTLGIGGVIVAGREAHLRGLTEEERNEALRQKAVAEKQRRRADEHLHKAFEAGDELLNRAQARLAALPGTEGVRRELLQRAQAFYEGFFAVEGDTPEVRRQAGLAHHRVGLIQERLGQYRAALKSYDAAEPLLRRLADDSPDNPEPLLALAGTHTDRAIVLQALNRGDEAGRAYAEAVAVLRRLTKAGQSARWREQLGRSLNSWAGYLTADAARRGEAEKAYREAVSLLDRLCTDYPGEPAYRLEKARTLANLGVLLQGADPKRAEPVWAQALALHEQLSREFSDVPEYQLDRGRTLLNLGVVWELNRQPKRAARAYADAAALLERLVEDYPRVTDYRHQLARAYTLTGLLREAQGDFEGAEAVRQKARQHWEKLVEYSSTFPVFRQGLARSKADLGNYLLRKGEVEKAAAVLGEAIRLQERLVADFQTNAEYRMDLARSLADLGQLFGRERQAAKEEAQYRRAVTLLEEAKARPAGWLRLRVDVQQNLVGNLLERKQWAKGAESLREAIRYQREAAAGGDAKEHKRLASFYVGLLEVLGVMRDHAGVSRSAKEYEAVLRQAGPALAGDFVKAAELVARCVGLAEGKAELVRAYGDQAMGLLREAVRRGFRDAARLRTGANFQALAGREDFRALLSELDAKKSSGQR